MMREKEDRSRLERIRGDKAFVLGGPVERLLGHAFPVWGRNRRAARRDEIVMEASFRTLEDVSYRRTGGRGRPGGEAEQHELPVDLFDMREQSRELDRENAIYNGLLTRCVENIIGDGIDVDPKTGDEKLNEAAKQWYDEWSLPSDGSDKLKCDVTGRMTRGEIEALAVRSVIRDGDCGFYLNPETGQVQPLEAERIGTPIDLLGKRILGNGNFLVNGVEMDRQGRHVAYYVGTPSGYLEMPNFASPMMTPWLKPAGKARARAHPVSILDEDATRIEARDFILLSRPQRFSQTRGFPALVSAFPLLDMLDEYCEVELAGSKSAAYLSLVISGEGAETAGYNRSEGDGPGTPEEARAQKLKHGTILYSQDGKATVVSGGRPAANFPPFVTLLFRLVGMPLGLPLEMAVLDFSTVPYSSARAALQQAYKAFTGWQIFMVNHVCRRLWRWRMGQAIKAGDLPPMDRFGSPEFRPPKWKFTDPVEEFTAKGLAMDRCMETLASVASEMQRDWQDLINQRLREIAYAQTQADVVNAKHKTLNLTWRDILGQSSAAAAVDVAEIAAGERERRLEAPPADKKAKGQ